MNWNEFLDKIKEAKKRKIKLGFNANVVTRLIFSGTFNHMIAELPEYTNMYPYKRYQRMVEEILAVMKSKAKLPKATKTEMIGIEDIDSDAKLILWRHLTNPLFRYPLSNILGEWAQKEHGFRLDPSSNPRARIMTLNFPDDAKKTSLDLYSQWDHVFDSIHSMDMYKKGERMACVLGITLSATVRWTRTGKQCLDVVIFDGCHEYKITLWPPRGQTTFSPAKRSKIKPCKAGLFLIKPSTWRGEKGGSLINFYPAVI